MELDAIEGPYKTALEGAVAVFLGNGLKPAFIQRTNEVHEWAEKLRAGIELRYAEK